MNIKRQSFTAVACLLMSGACSAASLPTQGVIRFEGSIVEGGCNTAISPRSVIEVSRCPTASHGSTFQVKSVSPVQGQVADADSTITVRLTQESRGDSRYYSQDYVLVDKAGKTITSGMYEVTVTSP